MEIWDLYDSEGNLTGETIQRGIELPENRCHLVIHFWVRNSKGEVLTQKRSQSVKSWPGKWSTTGGSVIAGEDSLAGLHREVQEELGIDLKLHPEVRKIHHYQQKQYLVDIYLLESDEIQIDQLSHDSEVETTQYLSRKEMETLIREEKMVPFRNDYLDLLFSS